MIKTKQLCVAAVLSLAFSVPAHAADIFGLFSCGSACDSGCCDTGCIDNVCGEPSGCCDSGCCDSRGCGESCLGKLFGCFGGCDNDCCDSGCGDVGCCETACCESDCCESDCCDSGCCASECPLKSCFGGLLGGLGCGNDDCCDSGCLSSCDGGCDSGCGSCRPRDYITLSTGWNLLDDYKGENGTIIVPPTLRGTFSDGWYMGMAKGRRLRDSLRGEIEFGFRSNTGDEWFLNGAGSTWSGHVYAYTGMVNLIRDLESCQCVGITPYVGAGIGLAIIDGELNTPGITVELDDAAFAYQLIVGASKAVSGNVDAFTEYRYFGTTDIDVVDAGSGATIDDHDPSLDNILFGLRIYR